MQQSSTRGFTHWPATDELSTGPKQ